MDILVYNGPGTSAEFVSQTIKFLKLYYNQSYAIRTVDNKILVEEPWYNTCKLLVIPGGRDLPYVNNLNGIGNNKIKQYVSQGGNFLGICAGAYYSSKQCEFEVNTKLQVKGARELQFFPDMCKGATFPGFDYDSETGALAADIYFEEDNKLCKVYYNGGGTFINADKYEDVKVLGRYNDLKDSDNAAIVLCKVNQGKAILMGVHPEYCPVKNNPIYEAIQQDVLDECFKNVLKHFELSFNEDSDGNKLEMSPIYCFNFNNLIDKLKQKENKDNGLIEDNKDTFQLNNLQQNNNNTQLILTDDTNISQQFNITNYFNNLNEYYTTKIQKNLLLNENDEPIIFGKQFLFSEVINSTQQILNDNSKFQSCIEDGTVCLGLIQLKGKGRGKNVWVSPKGCLQFSIYFEHENQSLLSPVLLQYLFSISIIKSIKGRKGYHDLPISLKWPNDIYGHDKEGKLCKLGGILVNSSFFKSNFKVVIGCGLNVDNSLPTLCINDIIKDYNLKNNTQLNLLTMEDVLANLLIQFQSDYQSFLINKQGLKPFLNEYYKFWLHSNQIITLKDQDNIKCKIIGITSDFGLLEVISLNPKTNEIDPLNFNTFLLQPDGNSFDMMHNFITKKK